MPELQIRLVVPIPSEPLVGTPALTFHHWLPSGDDLALSLTEGSMSTKLWFDAECTWWATRPSEEQLSKHVNVLVHRVKVDARVDAVSGELLDFMEHRDGSNASSSEAASLRAAYNEIAEQLFSTVLQLLNRLLLYAREQKGQYWLSAYSDERGQMHQFFVKANAKASRDGSKWFRFSPYSPIQISVRTPSEDCYIRADEWEEARRFVLSDDRPPLARTLLAGAERLAGLGHGRSALTEGVTALEVALFAFARNPEAGQAFGSDLAKRMGVGSLRTQVERMGLSGSVRYLLPVLFSEDQLPSTVLEGCRTAIAQRQTVVHEGQRAVREDVLRRSLRSLCDICAFLESVTADRSSGQGHQNTETRNQPAVPSIEPMDGDDPDQRVE